MYIYKTTNLINNKIYIGKSYKNEFDQTYYGSGKILLKAIEKYGREKFVIEVLKYCDSEDDLNLSEIEFIAKYKELNSPMYNIASGGTGGNTIKHLSEDDRKSIIDRRSLGLSSWHANMTEEEKKAHGLKISKAKKNKTNGRQGYCHSEESKAKISESNKGWQANNKSWKLNHTEAMKKRRGTGNPKAKKKLCVDNIVFNSVREAVEYFSITKTTFYNWRNNGKIKIEFL